MFFIPSLVIFVSQASRDEAIKQKEVLIHELNCLREELKQTRDDRDRQLAQIQALTGEVAYYKEFTGNSCAQLDSLTIKINDIEVCSLLSLQSILSLLWLFIIYFMYCALLCWLDFKIVVFLL